MINYNPTKPCETCDDVYVWFAGEWIHAGTNYSLECLTVTPGLIYSSPEERKANCITKYGEEDWNTRHNS